MRHQNMEELYISPDQFWDWFNRSDAKDDNSDLYYGDRSPDKKRLKKNTAPRSITETEAATSTERYIIMFGPHKPGKKTKVWESDGYLTMVGQVAHICDLRGRMLEEPTLLDDIDRKCVEELGELTIGHTEVQVIELDKK